MILSDSRVKPVFTDYGIMLPISPARAGRVLEFLSQGFVPGPRESAPPYPGPVFDMASAQGFLGLQSKPGVYGGQAGGPVVSREDLERVHQGEYVAALFGEGPDHAEGLARALLTTYELIDDQGQPHRYEPDRAVKPLAELFNAILAQVGGTYLAARLALAEGPGFCFYLGGGMHHARYDGGAGFCLLNDIVIAARRVQAENRARLIWVVDVDAHKGDGTAELVRFARERGELGTPGGPDILTLSIHMAQGWPLDEEGLRQAFPGGTPRLDRAPLVPSDVEIPIEAGEEAAYVPKLEKGLAALEKLSGARRPGNPKPDLVIVVDGADPYEHDGLPSSALLKLSLEQCLERDMLIYRYLTGRRIPSAWIEAGGYGNRAWEPEAHFLRGLR